MKIKKTITGSILFFSIMACIVPGLSQPAAPPTFDLSMIPTMVVLTANALEAQTALAAPPTPTLMPTESATATPKISLSGTSLLVRDDQTTVFTDREAGVEFVIPTGWMPLRVNEQEYFDAYVSDAAKDPAIYDRLVQIQTADPARFRLDAIDIRPGHTINGIITVMDFVFEAEELRSSAEISKEWRDAGKPYDNYKLISSGYEQAANGIKILVIEQKWNASPDVLYYKGVFFKITSGMIRFDFYTNLVFKDTVLPDFQMLIDSVTLLAP